MDARIEIAAGDPVVVTGVGVAPLPGASPERLDATSVHPWLKSSKSFKFMGKQDSLAVIAAGRALAAATLGNPDQRRALSVYLCTGYIPFEEAEIETIVASSMTDGRFSMEHFSTFGFERANPLLTFRCLPNMPIFHVSLNFQIEGPYQVAYPGPGQFYQLLEEALFSVASGSVECALVGGVADQENFLVRHHFQRLAGWPGIALNDGAGFLCLERRSHALSRGVLPLWQCRDLAIHYSSEAAYRTAAFAEQFEVDGASVTASPIARESVLPSYRGPGSLIALMGGTSPTAQHLRHLIQTWDGFRAESHWERCT